MCFLKDRNILKHYVSDYYNILTLGEVLCEAKIKCHKMVLCRKYIFKKNHIGASTSKSLN